MDVDRGLGQLARHRLSRAAPRARRLRVAVAVWSPPHLGVLVGAFVPLAWYALDTTRAGTGVVCRRRRLVAHRARAVLAVALLVLVAGRRR